METVRSADGTRVAYRTSGSGAPLVLVHGTTADHTRWGRLLPELERSFSVCAVDRRGRGGSGDAATYSIEREFEDVAAVIDHVGEPAHVLGHSYGAICSLEAALLSPNVRRLILYEPPIPVGAPLYPPGTPDRAQAAIDAGDLEAALTTFFREVVRMPEQEFEVYRALPTWNARIALAPTIPRELAVEQTYHLRPERLADLGTPTLLLLGGDSPPPFALATAALANALPDCRVVRLPGQQHVAMDTAPELFLGEVTRFLME